MLVHFLLPVLLQLFAVLAGRHAHNLAEGPEEVGIVVEPALVGNIVQGRGPQHLLPRQHHPAVQHIVVNASVGEADKFVGKPGYADAETPRQVFDTDRLCVVVVNIGQDLLDDAVAEGFAFHRTGMPHGPAEKVQDIHHQGVILEAVERVVFEACIPLVFTDPVDPRDILFRVLVVQLVRAHAPGRMGAEKLVQVDLSAAQHAQYLRGKVQVCPVVVVHHAGAGKPVH